MKKMILLAGAAVAAFVVTGCAGVVTNDGMPAPAVLGMNLYSDVSLNAKISPIQGDSYSIVKRGVTAQATVTSIFSAINMGDASYATLKKLALSNTGAEDLIDVQVDYKMDCILGINKITVTLTGTAIKYNK